MVCQAPPGPGLSPSLIESQVSGRRLSRAGQQEEPKARVISIARAFSAEYAVSEVRTMKRTHSRPAWRIDATIALAEFLLPAIAAAGTVTVNEAQGKLSIDTTDAAVDEVLAQIGQSQGFEVERIGAAAVEKLSGNFAGSLGDVVARILQNENHMIVHSATAKAGIARIVLFGSGSKAETASSAAPTVGAATRGNAAGMPKPLPREVISPNPSATPQQRALTRSRS